MSREQLLDRLGRLAIGHDGKGHRAPHKPLLLLWALGRFQQTGSSQATFAEAEAPLDALINEFGPPATSRHRAALPFYHLQSDGIWTLTSDTGLPAEPQRRRLLDAHTRGRLTPEVEDLLRREPDLVGTAAQLLLGEHFTDALAPLIVSAVGLDLDPAASALVTPSRRRRDPRWRAQVLLAWGHTCAMCGYDGQVAGQPVGLEAAHVFWHSQGGPDELDNGLALCSLHHALLDLGVLGLSEAGTILVSGAFVARSAAAHASVFDLAGRPLLDPLPRRPSPALEYVAWHGREVFKGEPLSA